MFSTRLRTPLASLTLVVAIIAIVPAEEGCKDPDTANEVKKDASGALTLEQTLCAITNVVLPNATVAEVCHIADVAIPALENVLTATRQSNAKAAAAASSASGNCAPLHSDVRAGDAGAK